MKPLKIGITGVRGVVGDSLTPTLLGGVIYPRINFGRDSLVGAAMVLHLLAETGQTVSEIVASLPPYFMVKEKLACPSHKIKDALRMIEREYDGYPSDRRDGVKIMLPDGWFLVRGSNTEPIIRVVAEGPIEARAREIVNHVFTQVRVAVNS